MSYKSKINELKVNREKYFPVIEMLLYAENSIDKENLPIGITDVSHIGTVMELIDLGYVNVDSFIINKHRRDITGLFYRGGYPLTDAGMKVYHQHLREKRGRLIRGVMLVVFLFLAIIIFYMIVM